jgi:hypothetical protein
MSAPFSSDLILQDLITLIISTTMRNLVASRLSQIWIHRVRRDKVDRSVSMPTSLCYVTEFMNAWNFTFTSPHALALKEIKYISNRLELFDHISFSLFSSNIRNWSVTDVKLSESVWNIRPRWFRFVYCSTMLSVASISRIMVGWLISNDLERIWKEASVA